MKSASWKTTAGGLLATIGSTLAAAPMPDGYGWLNSVGSVLIPVGTLILGAFARDNNVTSKQARAE